MKPLSLQRQRFAEEYAKCGNATAAAKEAGYSARYAGTNADKLLKNTNVQAAIAAFTEKAASQRIADAKERQEFWTALMRGEKEGDPEMFKLALKASELLGRAQLDFIEKIEHRIGPLAPDWQALIRPLTGSETS